MCKTLFDSLNEDIEDDDEIIAEEQVVACKKTVEKWKQMHPRDFWLMIHGEIF